MMLLGFPRRPQPRGDRVMLRWIIAGLMAALCCLPAVRSAHAGENEKVKKLIVDLLENKDVKKRRLAVFDLEIVGPRVKGVLQALQTALEKDPEPVVRQ